MRRSSRLMIATGLALAAVVLVASIRGGPEARGPDADRASRAPPCDVVLVLIDTLRPDYLACHGFPAPTAPFLDLLATESSLFDRALSTSSWTAPATASLFTGAYPARHGVVEGFFAHRQRAEREVLRDGAMLPLNRLPEALPTLPELFRARGYRTFGLTANINISEAMGFDRGFDRFWHDPRAAADDVLRQVRRWSAELEASRPFFLYLHFNDPHEPYHGRAPWYRRQDGADADARARYLSEISYLDDRLARLYRELALDRALLVVVSDHGEEFRDHGQMGHLATLYRELNQVLMLFRGPGQGIRAQRLDVGVSLVDVLPSILELADAGPPPAGHGLSLASLLRADPGAGALRDSLAERTLFAHRIGWGRPDQHVWAVLDGPWKLIRWSTGGRELYDHRHDRGEHDDLATRRPDVARRLAALLGDYLAIEPVDPDQRTLVPLDPQLVRTLRSLGYAR